MRVHVGTSGYNYPEWRGTFYPDTIKASAMFDYYAARFQTVEINYTFCRMPTIPTHDQGWSGQAPAGFSVHAEGAAAHHALQGLEGLRRRPALLRRDARASLGAHLATLLFQLPPTFGATTIGLTSFLAHLPRDVRCAFEFRHDSWLADEVYRALARARRRALHRRFRRQDDAARAARRDSATSVCATRGTRRTDLERWADQVAAQAATGTTRSCTSSTKRKGRGRSSRRLPRHPRRARHHDAHDRREKVDRRSLGPVPVIGRRGVGDKAAMAAVRFDAHRDRRVTRDGRIAELTTAARTGRRRRSGSAPAPGCARRRAGSWLAGSSSTRRRSR